MVETAISITQKLSAKQAIRTSKRKQSVKVENNLFSFYFNCIFAKSETSFLAKLFLQKIFAKSIIFVPSLLRSSTYFDTGPESNAINYARWLSAMWTIYLFIYIYIYIIYIFSKLIFRIRICGAAPHVPVICFYSFIIQYAYVHILILNTQTNRLFHQQRFIFLTSRLMSAKKTINLKTKCTLLSLEL